MASSQPHASATAAAQPGDILLVIHDFAARSADEISLIRGELIELIERDDDFNDGWYLGKHLQDGRTGLFPEVYTKLAPTPLTAPLPDTRSTRHTQSSISETTATSIFSVMNRDSNTTVPTPSDIGSHDQYDSNTPAPLNTPGGSQRAVSAPHSVSQFPPMAGAPSSQRSISMIMDHARDNGQDSPVITETLGVIDEHITEMNTPRSSLMASVRNRGNDSGSEYSSYVDHRLSYITGNETDEEENLTHEQVVNWNPAQAAQYLHEIGVEQKHCDVFQEQEITGEVLLNLEKSELFMPELELGPIGRRLATWHKIRAFQEEMKSKRDAPTPSVTGSTNASIPSTNGSAFARDSTHRSPTFRYSQQNSPMIPEDDRMGISRLQSNDSVNRPSAASVREFNHARRHSSLDYAKSNNNTPPISPGTQPSGHRPQGSLDKTWTMTPVVSAQPGNRPARASTMLGFGALGMASPGLPLIGDRRVMTTNNADLASKPASVADFDRGYLSSGEVEGTSKGGKIRNLLRKSQPNSAAHSRQNSGNTDARSILSTDTRATAKRHSRFGSAGSIFNALDKQLEFHPTLGHQSALPSPPLSRTESRALARAESNATRMRTNSFRDSSSASGPSTTTTLAGIGQTAVPPSAPLQPPPAIPSAPASATMPNDATPIVTKLDYTESPTSLTSKSNPVSPSMKSESFGALGRMTNSLRSGKRSSSDALTTVEKSQISAPIVPTTVPEAPLQSPARTGSTTPSAASKSIEMDTTPDTSIKGAAAVPGSRTVSASTTATATKRKSKKETSAYKSLQVISPQQAMQNCVHSGWMHKKSAKMTSTFKARYFVLQDKRLSYFYSLDDKIEKGLIDINAHRVEQVENDIITSLYATLSGAKSNPTSPANVPAADGSTPSPGYGQGGPFFFKLVPPKSGLSKAVQFTRPAIHYFAVDNYEDGRQWFLALKKASIDRDESQPITSTYTQKTISLAKAQAQRQRPPALMNTEDLVDNKVDTAKTAEDVPQTDENGLAIEGLNLSYEHIPSSVDDTSVNGIPDMKITAPEATAAAAAAGEADSAAKRPQSEQPASTINSGDKPSSTLRLVRSLSGGLSRHNETLEESPKI